MWQFICLSVINYSVKVVNISFSFFLLFCCCCPVREFWPTQNVSNRKVCLSRQEHCCPLSLNKVFKILIEQTAREMSTVLSKLGFNLVFQSKLLWRCNRLEPSGCLPQEMRHNDALTVKLLNPSTPFERGA